MFKGVQSSTKIGGIELSQLGDPIPVGLADYSEKSHVMIDFDLNEASYLKATPDRGYSAKNTIDVMANEAGKATKIGSLVILALKAGDGTGSEETYDLEGLSTELYPDSPRVLPRSKDTVHTEFMFPIAAFDTSGSPRKTIPAMHTNSLDLLGKAGRKVRKIANLGQDPDSFAASLKHRGYIEPVVFETVGYDARGHRFGDPHAIYNDQKDTIQICGFMAISDEETAETLSAELDARMPKFIK